MALSVAFACCTPAPVDAARPLLDTHKLDGVFALYARDVQVPWKKATVRLDTYSGAPVDFSAYEVDPADVVIAGSTRMHAVDTSHMRAAARWKFTPPPGYKFESSEVEVPLQGREGFFVVEARRGDASQQTWIDLTRVGIVTKETPEGWLLYGADLGTGAPLRNMRVTLLVGRQFQEIKTGPDGIARGIPGARFALAEWGHSKTFLSLAPQPPLPQAIVGVRADRGVVRAGETLRVVGFARKRDGKILKPMQGEVRVSAVVNGKSVASSSFQLAASGGFSGDLAIPSDTQAGDLAILASAGGATGGTSVHVDAAGDYTLRISALCDPSCSATSALPLRIAVQLHGTGVAGQNVSVRVVRTPHVLAAGAGESERWGTTTIANTTLKTGADGTATLTLPAPTDGLSSTYGVVASTQAATATTQIVAPNAQTVVSIVPRTPQVNVGQLAVFDVRGFDVADGRPAAGRTVNVKLMKGPAVAQQTVLLDASGYAQVSFTATDLGTDIVTAELADNPVALDASAITIAPSAFGARALNRSTAVSIKLDKARYKLNEEVHVDATLAGANGSALFTVEGAHVAETRVVGVGGGHASSVLSLANASGAVRIGVAFVKDGAMYTSDVPVDIDGPGYPRVTALSADKNAYAPGATAHIAIRDGDESHDALLAIRISDGRPTGGAAFDDAPAILAAGGTTTQDPAAPDPSWHAYVAPAGSKAQDIFGANPSQRNVAAQDNSLAVSAPRALVWRVDRATGDSFDVEMPKAPGRYVVSVLKISSDGDVGAASVAVNVQ